MRKKARHPDERGFLARLAALKADKKLSNEDFRKAYLATCAVYEDWLREKGYTEDALRLREELGYCELEWRIRYQDTQKFASRHGYKRLTPVLRQVEAHNAYLAEGYGRRGFRMEVVLVELTPRVVGTLAELRPPKPEARKKGGRAKNVNPPQ